MSRPRLLSYFFAAMLLMESAPQMARAFDMRENHVLSMAETDYLTNFMRKLCVENLDPYQQIHVSVTPNVLLKVFKKKLLSENYSLSKNGRKVSFDLVREGNYYVLNALFPAGERLSCLFTSRAGHGLQLAGNCTSSGALRRNSSSDDLLDEGSVPSKGTEGVSAAHVEDPTWELLANRSAREQITAWGATVGWIVIWDAPDWEIPQNTQLQGSFFSEVSHQSVIEQIVSAVDLQGMSIRAEFHPKNKTLLILRKGA